MDGLEPLLIDVRVNLRSRNIGVAEHFLNDAEVGAVAKQMCRETVPKQMWINVDVQPGMLRVLFHNLPDARGR